VGLLAAWKEAFTLAPHGMQFFFANHSSPQEFFILLIFVSGGSFSCLEVFLVFYCFFFSFFPPLIVGSF